MKANSIVRPYKGIKVGKEGKFTKYSVSQNKKKEDGTWENVGWVNVMVAGGKEIPEKNPNKQMLHIESIQGVDLDKYNDKLNVTVWVDGYVEGESEEVQEGFSKWEEDCPF